MHPLNSLFKFLPLFLLSTLGIAWVIGPFIPVTMKAFFYSISLTIKQVLMWILPYLVFGFMFTSITKIGRRALMFIGWLIPAICFSNFLSTHIAYGIGCLFVKSSNVEIAHNLTTNQILNPLWSLKIKAVLSNEIALFLGIFSGVLCTWLYSNKLEKLVGKMDSIIMSLLNKFFVPLTPLFIFGFALKLQHENTLQLVCLHYSKLLLVILLAASAYILTLYFIFNRCRIVPFKESIRNMLPALLTGFSTMSSAASMPLTLIAVKKNTQEGEIANGLVPATVNVHLMGDCFSIPLTALGILTSFGIGFPSYNDYLLFATYFVLAKFAVAAVPGGGILVMLPILEKHLGFSGEMLSLITAIYIIFDPFITSMNVFGNGAFAMGFIRVFKRIGAVKTSYKILNT